MGRTATGTGALVLAAASAGALQTAPAAAAAVPPTITSAFTPNLIGVGGSVDTALSFTITNPNSSSLSGIGFTDTLPAALSIDNPNGENGTCGSASLITAAPGGQTITLSGGSLKGAASCTVSVSLIADQAGAVQNDTGPVSSSAGSSASGDTETLTVLPPPTVSITHVRNHASYTFGEIVHPRYSCAQPADPSALSDCSAVDDLGNGLRSGGWLDTRSPGQHSLTISATSADGLITDDTVNYTVLPDNRFTISRLQGSGGTLTFALAVPGPGRISVVERAGRAVIGSYRRLVETNRTILVHVRPSAAGQAGLPARVALAVSYTPQGGRVRTITRKGIAVN